MKQIRLFFILLSISLVSWNYSPASSAGKYNKAIKESRRLMDSLLQSGRTPGLDIAISIEGKLIWSEGFGFADLEHQVAVMAGKTRFRIGSVSKPITAAGMGRLMDEGKMQLEESIQLYVPYFPEKKYPLTVRQVAGHIGGIRHYRNNEFEMARYFETVEEGIGIFKDDSLLFKPGERYSYSSYGFNLLSAAIEGASGKSFLDFMQDEVFDPIGMSSTCADINRDIVVNRASFYELNEDGKFVNARYVDNSYKWAGGGFISTTLDLLKFGEAHLKAGYLSLETLNALVTSQKLNNGDPTGYGVGWSAWGGDLPGYGHGGGSVGGITDFKVYPEQELVIAVLSNSSDTRYGDVVYRIVKLFLEAE